MKQVHSKLKQIFAVVLLLLGASFSTVNAQTGYIYVHKKTLDEASSLDFNFNVSGVSIGTTTVPAFNLNDKPDHIALLDIGCSSTGTLWATANVGGALYYRKAGTTNWVATNVASGALRVDGGLGETAYYTTSTGVYFFDGTTSISILIYNGATLDIGSGWNLTPYLINASGNILHYSGVGTTWTAFYSSNTTTNLDVNPINGNVYATNTAGTNVYQITPAGVTTSMGLPTNQSDIKDVAVDALGNVFVSGIISTAQAPEVSKWTGGTSWAVYEPTSAYSYNLTGGPAGQMWSVVRFIQNLLPYHNIFSRSLNGSAASWIDDERVRTSVTNGNSEMIAVAPGTYTITETVPTGWDLQNVTVYDPSSNSTSDVNANTATLNVAANKVVHVIFQNGVVNSYTMTNNCSSVYNEDFGTGATGTFGPAFVGQTSYHYIGDATRASDGYYKVVSQAFPDFNTWQAITFYDHTSNNGTGRMLAVNAAFDQNEFFRRRFTGVIPGATYNFSAWIANLTPGALINPNVSFKVVDPTTNTVTASNITGDLPSTATTWIKYTLSFVATSNVLDLMLVNNNIGGDGNDLAIDDISFALVPVITPITTVAHTGCGTLGSITVTSPVGASYEYSSNGFATAPAGVQTSPIFGSLATGSYTISARFIGTTNCISSKTDFVGATICGTIWDDANGNAINSGENSISGVWVNLVDPSSGAVLQSVQVDASGNYSFSGLPQNTNYKIILSNTPQTVGANLTSATLPTGYTATGTNLSGTASTANTTGAITVNTGTGGLTVQNFGIEKLPDSDPKTLFVSYPTGGIIPAGTVTKAVSGSDAEDGTLGNGKTVVITTPPANAKMYYNGTLVTANMQILNFDPANIRFDNITGGSTSVVFNYAFVDAAGKQDPTPASYTLSWSGALPITLGSFTAAKENEKVRLLWTTATEQNVSKFAIEHSTDATTFTAIADVTATGNSSITVNYSWLHNDPVAGYNYYRLKIIDIDGRYIYSNINAVKMNSSVEPIVTVYPNPVHASMNISLPRSGTAHTMISIYSTDGKLVYTKATGIAQTIPVPVSSFASGVYYIRISENGSILYNATFMKE